MGADRAAALQGSASPFGDAGWRASIRDCAFSSIEPPGRRKARGARGPKVIQPDGCRRHHWRARGISDSLLGVPAESPLIKAGQSGCRQPGLMSGGNSTPRPKSCGSLPTREVDGRFGRFETPLGDWSKAANQSQITLGLVNHSLLHESRGVLERHHDAFAQRSQRGLNLFRLSIVLRAQHTADHCFADTQALGKLGVWHAAFTHSKV